MWIKHSFYILLGILWSSTRILMELLSWNVENLSIHIWCNANMHKVLCLLIYTSSLFLLNVQLLKDLGNVPYQRLFLPNVSKFMLICEGTPTSGDFFSWNIVFNNSNGVRYSPVKLSTSRWTWTFFLKFINNSCWQSRTCRMPSSGSSKQHLHTGETHSFWRCSWWAVPASLVLSKTELNA